MKNIAYTNTVNWFRKLSNNSDASVALSYCLPAVRSIGLRLVKQDTVVDEEPSLCFLAAVLALKKYSLTDEFSRFTSFKAGEVSIETDNTADDKSIDQLLKCALEDAKPFLKSGIIFKSCYGGGDIGQD